MKTIIRTLMLFLIVCFVAALAYYPRYLNHVFSTKIWASGWWGENSNLYLAGALGLFALYSAYKAGTVFIRALWAVLVVDAVAFCIVSSLYFAPKSVGDMTSLCTALAAVAVSLFIIGCLTDQRLRPRRGRE
jgi:hypothetical protein